MQFTYQKKSYCYQNMKKSQLLKIWHKEYTFVYNYDIIMTIVK